MAQLQLCYVAETEKNTEEKYLCTVTKRNEILITHELSGEKVIIPITEWEEIKSFIDKFYKQFEYK